MAFGDSITHGTKSDPASFLAFPLPPPSYSYPTQLQSLLISRYSGQTLAIANEGWPGEFIDDGLKRLPSALATNAPEVVLLLDGANDLLNTPSSATTQYIAGKLTDMVRACKTRVAANRVLLANFPHQFIGTPPNRGAGWAFVPELNGRIAAVASSEGATLIDLYAPMNADVKRYIGQDGLHPTETGFTLMAQTFAAVIQQKFEVKTTAR
jgi:lysophospholipase L1-like esterase